MASTAERAGSDGAGRLWAGSTLEVRRAQRRVRLIDATLDLIGESGTSAVAVRSVCRRAGLTDRYFYENFPSRDDLLVAVFEEVAADLHAAAANAIESVSDDHRGQARAAVRAIVDVVRQDPRKARLVFVDSLSEPALLAAGIGGMPTLSRLFRQHFAPSGGTDATRRMTTVSVAAGVAGLLIAWQAGDLKVTDAELIEHCVDLIVPPRPRA